MGTGALTSTDRAPCGATCGPHTLINMKGLAEEEPRKAVCADRTGRFGGGVSRSAEGFCCQDFVLPASVFLEASSCLSGFAVALRLLALLLNASHFPGSQPPASVTNRILVRFHQSSTSRFNCRFSCLQSPQVTQLLGKPAGCS